MDAEELANWFAYHPPSTDDVVKAHEWVRSTIGSVAQELNATLPEGREKAMALRALDDACMYANASIARTQLQSGGGGGPG